MKLNKLICSLMIIGSTSLTACMPSNVGGANNASVTSESAHTESNVASKNGLPTDARETVDYVAKGIASAALDLPFGPLKFISNFAIDGIITAIFGEQKDQTLETLEQMNKKLDKIYTNLETAIGISETTATTLSQFYASNMMNDWANGLSKIDNLANEVTSKYSNLATQRVFGNSITSGQLEKLYAYAQQQGKSKDTLLALDAMINYRTSKVGTSSDLFNAFSTNFKSSGGSGEIMVKLNKGKQNYLNALVNIAAHPDFMAKIHDFNGQILLYQSKIFGSYQKLYNIQLAQLAYRYASGANIQLSNLDLHDVKATGFEGFKQAVLVLNETYNRLFAQLTSEIKTNFSPINDAELYSFVNVVFNSERPLLDKNTFVLNNQGTIHPGSCIINNLTFNEVNRSSGNNAGVATLGARCVVKYDSQRHEATYINTSIDIPYVMSGGVIKRYAVSGIYFDQQSQQLKTADQTGNTATDLNSDDVNKLCASGNDIGRNRNVVDLADNKYVSREGARFYQEFGIKADTNVFIYPVKDATDKKDTGLPSKDWTRVRGTYSAEIKAGLHKVNWVKKPDMDTYNTSYLGLANGKAFCVNMIAYHYNNNDSVKTEFGIHGVGNNSLRVDNKNITFNSGNYLQISGLIFKENELNDKPYDWGLNGIGLWNITSSTPTPVYTTENYSKIQ
ncbi:hypothetical protein [Aquella oligotrophica]|uniref:Uncharacterized protein n=1 Tax=Aquella oligotrophica TaxID=2067065 RepID=A0A2I7N3M1_9NEIS|nr:hypothetical protein [Aquella oligotrophica]AUR51028.1 hypothetical protein CUN60_01480 [Aquella oligotrophica]